jgi:hypothetical protein
VSITTPTTANTQTGNYTAVLADENQEVFFDLPGSSGSVVFVFTIPKNADVAFPIGTVIWVTAELAVNGGFGVSSLMIAGDTGVTVRGRTTVATAGAYVKGNGGALVVKEATDTWIAV